MKINLSKKKRIIIIAILVLVLGGTGGYLLWRVNQDQTVAPTDSEAGQSNNGTCWACCKGTRPTCPVITDADRANGWECSPGGVYCATNKLCNGGSVTCGDGVSIPIKAGEEAKDACPACLHAAPDDDEPVGGVDCNVGSQCSNVCQWPAVAYCKSDGTCDCNSSSNNGCEDDEPTCTPVCTGNNSTASCTARCSGCNNLYTYTKDCPAPAPVNTCDAGAWITKPTGTYAHCAAIKYTAKGTDSDGIDESSIVVKLNNVARTNVSKVTNGTSTTITENLSSSTNCLDAGTYTLKMTWKDKQGVTSDNCALDTTFTVAEATNVCDAGSTWTTKPTGTYAYCSSIKYGIKAIDSDGINESSISVKLNSLSRTGFTKVTSGTTTTISETLSSSTSCLAPGTYTLNTSWKDKLGVGGSNCALNTSFTVLSGPTNVCDAGSTWTAKPTGTYAYCANIKYIAKAIDSDGIDESSISVKLNNVSRTSFTKSSIGTTTTISETLSSSLNCLAPGTYSLAMSWKDKLGASSTSCALDTSFTVLQQIQNPSWSVTKGVVKMCFNENTEDSTSKLTYTITVKNTGAGSGTITKIIDTLDSKVLQTYISDVSNSGIYGDGDITWTLSTADSVFTAGQQRVFTYTVTVPKDDFGIYDNMVTVYPSTGNNIIANASITAECNAQAPATGLFDSTLAKVILGAVFILIGFNFSNISKLYLNVSNFSRKLRISLNDISQERRKKNFEKRVVKR